MESNEDAFKHTVADLNDLGFKRQVNGINLDEENISQFALSCSLLFALAYCLSLLVAYLHMRAHPLVYPLSKPPRGQYFCEYFILLKTSLKPNSSWDHQLRGRVYIQLVGAFADTPQLELKKGRGTEYFLGRGGVNIFVYHSPFDLGDIRDVKFTLVNDAPYETPYVLWRPCFIQIICPANGKNWGIRTNEVITCYEHCSIGYACQENLRDQNGVLKYLMQYTHWFSLMNRPVRFGMFNNLINTLMLFFTMVSIFAFIMMFQYIRSAEDAEQKVSGVLRNPFFFGLLSAIISWLVSLIVEIVLRYSAPKFCCQSFKYYSGLCDPIMSPYLLRDFFIDYNWEAIRPLIPRDNVLVIRGSRHGYAHSVFPIGQPHSVYNLWGFFNLDEQREWSIFMRSINTAALPLPLSMRWLSREAWGSIEELMLSLEHTEESQACLFHVWLQDWPMDYIQEPQQAGMIFSNILCRNILSLMNMHGSDEKRARLARMCLFQWHGMLCFLFLHIIVQEADRRNEATSAIKQFIYKTIDYYSSRNPADIKTSWETRKKHLKALGAGKKRIIDLGQTGVGSLLRDRSYDAEEDGEVLTPKEELLIQEKGNEDDDDDDENWSADPDMSTSAVGKFADYLKKMRLAKNSTLSETDDVDKSYDFSETSSLDYDYFQSDELVFESSSADPRNQANNNEAISDALMNPDETHHFYKEEDEQQQVKRRRKKTLIENILKKQGLIKKDDDESCRLNMNNCSKKINMNNSSKNKDGASKAKEQQLRRQLLKEMIQAQDINMNKESKPPSPTGTARAAPASGANSRRQSDAYHSRELCPMAQFEMIPLGKPFNEEVMPLDNPADKYRPFRHKDEMSGYCCDEPRCAGYLEVHEKVGHSALEVLKIVLKQLLYYAMDSRFNRLTRSKCWLRKKMISTIFSAFMKKAGLYNNDMFKRNDEGVLEKTHDEFGFIRNELLAMNYTILQITLDVGNINKQVCKVLQAKQIREIKQKNLDREAAKMKSVGLPSRQPLGFIEKQIDKLVTDKPRTPRCLFCAKPLDTRKVIDSLSKGCYKLEKLVKFFSRDTVIVAEKEINMEFQSKVTIQNYCAMIVNIAKKELLMELEDPPLVLATKVCRAMVYVLLDECLPKHTDVKDMSVEELRRIGTRRQRIQARHDTQVTRLKESLEEKRRKALIQALIDEFASKWRINMKENTLTFCSQLLAQCLVQERMLSFSIYSGCISKEHEVLLGHSKYRLNEIEEKAHECVLRIARSLYGPMLKEILESGDDVDVLFTRQNIEINYFCEAISVMQVANVPTFLKTCCFYIDDIVDVKVQEFKEFMKYMNKLEPLKDLFLAPKLHMIKGKRYKIDKGSVEMKLESQDMSIASPILRWGKIAVGGEPPLSSDLKPADDSVVDEKFDKVAPQVLKWSQAETGGDPAKEAVVSSIIKARKTTKGFVETMRNENNKQLQMHLARVQARLTDQIAIASQSMADAYVIETDFQRDYLPDELYNVEFYCTGKMKVPFATLVGVITAFAVFVITVLLILFTLIKSMHSGQKNLMEWGKWTSFSFAIYFVILEPVKALIYRVFKLFPDSF